MPEPEFTREQFTSPLENSFRDRMDSFARQLMNRETEHEASQWYGPHYHVKRADGRRTDCYVVHTQRAHSQLFDIVAVDNANVAVAHCHVDLRRVQNQLMASSDMVTGLRGKGLAVPTMLVYFDVMRRAASELREPITIRGRDGHRKRIRYLLGILGTDIDSPAMIDDIHAELAQLRSERPRWINLFGAGGKLGYNSELEKYIRPASVAPLTQLSAVTLTDRLHDGLPEVTSETHLSEHEAAAHQTARQALIVQAVQEAAKKPKLW